MMKILSTFRAIALLTFCSIGGANAANVTVFNNNTYVDAAGEAANVIATMTLQGHTVTSFTGITAADFTTAVIGQDFLAIPELENGDLNAALTPAARTAISNFVNGGGQLIVFGESNISDESLLNAIFGWSLANSGIDLDGVVLTGPRALTGQNGTYPVTTASVPPGANIVFTDGANTALFDISVGAGRVTFLAYDWFDAAPNGAQDGGWLTELDIVLSAVAPSAEAVPTLSQWSLMLLALVMGIVGIGYGRKNNHIA